MTAIYKSYENAPFMKYKELKRNVTISFKVFTSTLKKLERNNINSRKRILPNFSKSGM